MNTKTTAKLGLLAVLVTAVVFSVIAQPKGKTSLETIRGAMPLELNQKLPLAIASHGIEWKGDTYHLVRLGSIQFQSDKSGHLQAEIQAGITTFDDVPYDISAAVFNDKGALLGTARTPCKVERTWLGKVLQTQTTLNLDFGESLDYAKASQFMLNISRRTVLTPDQWQK